ncbi:MAG: GatB/YqeY domain-containing protein [Rhizomicrobium sp.]
MGLREQFNEQMKEAMKAKDQRRLSTLRMVNAALKDKDIANRTETSREGISDDEILGMLGKMIKQREESAEAFDKGGRPEMAKSEREEVDIIRSFMPKQMSADEQRAAIQGVIADVGAASMKDMGKIMAALKERYAGQMDFGKASGMVKDILTPK